MVNYYRLHFKIKIIFAAASKASKQSTLQFKPVSKKNPWSDDESDGQSADSEMEAEEVVAPRERVERKTKGKLAPWP